MKRGEVARIEPLNILGRVFVGFEIALDDPGAPTLQPAPRDAIARQDIAFIVAGAKLDAERWQAMQGEVVDLLLKAVVFPAQRS